MDNKRWTAVSGALLLAGIVASGIFLQQRNESRQRLRESREQIADLDRRNEELKELLEDHKSQLSAETELAQKKQTVLAAVEIQIAELKARLDQRQAELDTLSANLLQATGELARLRGGLASAEVRAADLVSERDRLEGERNSLASRISRMQGEDTKRGAIIATLERQVVERDSRITALDKKSQALSDSLAVKEKQLAESQDSLRALQAEADGLKKDLVAVKESADGLEAQIKALNDERDGLIVQTTVLTSEGGDLRAHIAEMEIEHREALTGREEKITALSSALNTCDVRLDNLRKDEDVLALKLVEANRTITGLRDQLQDVIIRVPALKGRLEQSLEKNQAVRENLAEARSRQAELEFRQEAMKETHQALVAGLKQQLDSQEASIEEYRQKLKVSFVDRILFGFSRVHISAEGKAALDQLAGVLATVPEGNISVVGHADSIPVASKFQYRFPSNWELSSARAAAVARYLLKQGGLEPSRIEVVGLSSYQPIADNDTDDGRAKNRRVEIIISQGRYPDWETR